MQPNLSHKTTLKRNCFRLRSVIVLTVSDVVDLGAVKCSKGKMKGQDASVAAASSIKNNTAFEYVDIQAIQKVIEGRGVRIH